MLNFIGNKKETKMIGKCLVHIHCLQNVVPPLEEELEKKL